MSLPLELQSFNLGARDATLYVPQLKAVQQLYEQQKKKSKKTPFPYWAQVWPASIALAQWLLQQPKYTRNKKVLELAAGLGLPSIAVAALAQKVTCTDYMPEAVAIAQQSASYNGFENIDCRVLNWKHLPQDLEADVLLLSDVNYEPQQFEVLFRVLQQFLQKGTTIILSTPQRLMARPFIERLLPWCIHQQQAEVDHHKQPVSITLLVLRAS